MSQILGHNSNYNRRNKNTNSSNKNYNNNKNTNTHSANRNYNNNKNTNYMNTNCTNINKNINYNVVEELQDYMFTGKNLTLFSKNIFCNIVVDKPTTIDKTARPDKMMRIDNAFNKKEFITPDKPQVVRPINKINSNIYKPLKKDSLFWCFFILKYGFSKYEMEVGSQYFTVEKTEKFKYIELFREKESKDILKMNKIKPLSELEDDLANKDRISIKTFFALCIIEKINVLLVDKRKIYHSMNNDTKEVNVIHRNSESLDHHIELNVSESCLTNLKDTYYNVTGFDNNLKSMTSYKVDELLDLCKKLNIPVSNDGTKKLAKKYIYELLVQNF
jgi:hypothetical protein